MHHHLLSQWLEEGRIVPLCPEVAAGFPTPRAPAEIQSDKSAVDVLAGAGQVLEDNGTDVTDMFRLGAQIALETAEGNNCRFALLTDGSPSCGSTYQFSGAFDGATKPGKGVVASLLVSNGISVFTESQIENLAAVLTDHL